MNEDAGRAELVADEGEESSVGADDAGPRVARAADEDARLLLGGVGGGRDGRDADLAAAGGAPAGEDDEAAVGGEGGGGERGFVGEDDVLGGACAGHAGERGAEDGQVLVGALAGEGESHAVGGEDGGGVVALEGEAQGDRRVAS